MNNLLYAGFILLIIYYAANFISSVYATFGALEDSTQDAVIDTILAIGVSLIITLMGGIALNLYTGIVWGLY